MRHYNGEGGILKECDINRDKIPICVRGIASITPLKSGVAQEDTLHGFSREFVLSRSKNMNKTNTTKDARGKAKERLNRKKNRMRDLII